MSLHRLVSLLALSLVAAAPASALAADTTPPKIIHTAPATAPSGAALKIVADIIDESGVFEPKLHFRAAGSTKYLTASMIPVAGSRFEATIPESVMAGDVEYFIEAYDTNGNGPSRFASEQAPQRVKVVAAPEPIKLVAPPPPAEGPDKIVISDATKPPEKVDAQVTKPASSADLGMKVAGYSLVGVGVAGVVVGAILGATANSQAKQAQDETSARLARQKENGAKSMAMGADVSYVAGGVLAAVGVVLVVLPLLKPSEPAASEAKQLDASLSIGASGATLTVLF